MKKNLLLYVLLLFLVVMNVFFLYNYLGNAKSKDLPKERKSPGSFLARELGFDEAQKEEFRALNREHHQRMRGISDDIRQLKDVFFSGLSDTNGTVNIDSLAEVLGDLEVKKELEVYDHFKQVQTLCNEKQKAIFGKIIKDALKKRARGPAPARGNGPRGDRTPRPKEMRGDRPMPQPH